jgi:hypothetical protein
MPTNRVPTAVTNVDNKIAVAIMAEPISTETGVPTCPEKLGRYPWYSFLFLGVENRASLRTHAEIIVATKPCLETHLADSLFAYRRLGDGFATRSGRLPRRFHIHFGSKIAV